MSEIPAQLEDFFYEEMENALYTTTGRFDNDLSDLPRDNLCDPVANEFAVNLEHEFGYTVQSPVNAPVGGSKHFVAVVMEHPEYDLDSPIVVDGTLKQFDSTAPEIVIKRLDSAFVENTYDYVSVDT